MAGSKLAPRKRQTGASTLIRPNGALPWVPCLAGTPAGGLAMPEPAPRPSWSGTWSHGVASHLGTAALAQQVFSPGIPAVIADVLACCRDMVSSTRALYMLLVGLLKHAAAKVYLCDVKMRSCNAADEVRSELLPRLSVLRHLMPRSLMSCVEYGALDCVNGVCRRYGALCHTDTKT